MASKTLILAVMQEEISIFGTPGGLEPQPLEPER